MDNKYIIEADTAIRQAGFQYKSKLDMEREKIEKELEKFSGKSSHTTLLLTFFPIFGLHRMTNGKVFSGLLFACTAGGAFLWWLYDMIMIAGGRFTDQYGKVINSAKVTELQIELETLESKYEAGKKIFEIEKDLKKQLLQLEYDCICEELGYEK